MPKPSRRLSRAVIVRALTRLGELCAEQNSRVEIATYGGKVMMLAYDCREASKDIDEITTEFYGAPALEPGKRWLVEKLLREVRRG